MMHGTEHAGRIAVEGVEIPFMRLADGRLMCDFFMFQLFDSEEELAATLQRTRGLLWDAIGATRAVRAGITIRPNIYDINDAELKELIHAVRKLKEMGIYDDFVRRHYAIMTDGSQIHTFPTFLPWHRVFILEFEQALQIVSLGLRLAFWNWAADAAAGKDAPLWQTEGPRTFFGGDGDSTDQRVTTGPCADWRILTQTNSQWLTYRSGHGLLRALGRGEPTLPQPDQLRRVLNVTPYDCPPWYMTSDISRSFRNALEGWGPAAPQLHNQVHVWIGGVMKTEPSPNDPVFFLHHAFVDYVWATWQKLHPLETYQPGRDGPPGQNIDDPMPHLRTPVTPRQTLDTRAMGYEYPDEPLSEMLPRL